MLLKKIHGKLGARLVVPNAPKTLRKELLQAFRFDNPAYLSAVKFSPHGYVSPAIKPHLNLVVKNARDIFVPRGIEPLRHLSDRGNSIWKRIIWEDLRVTAPVTFPSLKIALNREQRMLFKNYERTHSEYGVHLYVSPTGTGKTILLTRIAMALGQRTLILFNTEQVRRAWYEGLKLALGLTEKDIGLVKQGTWRIGKHVTLGSIQTLARRKARWPELFDQTGTLIVDECDTVTAPSLWQFVMSCPALNIVGATATERAEEGENYYLRACFGKTRGKVYAPSKDTDTSMAVQRVNLIHTLFEYEQEDSLIDWNELGEYLLTDENRNRLIVYNVIKDIRAGKPCLLVTKRLAHVEILRDMLKGRGIKSVNTITGDTNADALYTEKLIQAVKGNKIQCVIATAAAIKRGANLNPLAVLHVAMPLAKKNNLEQLIGRVRRRSPGKTACEVSYYLDSQTRYLMNVFKRVAVPTFRRLKIPPYQDMFIC